MFFVRWKRGFLEGTIKRSGSWGSGLPKPLLLFFFFVRGLSSILSSLHKKLCRTCRHLFWHLEVLRTQSKRLVLQKCVRLVSYRAVISRSSEILMKLRASSTVDDRNPA